MIAAFCAIVCGLSLTQRITSLVALAWSTSPPPLGVLADLERELERVVAGEYVEDVALLDGLAHRVDVERHGGSPSGGRLRPNSSRVLALGVAVNAK